MNKVFNVKQRKASPFVHSISVHLDCFEWTRNTEYGGLVFDPQGPLLIYLGGFQRRQTPNEEIKHTSPEPKVHILPYAHWTSQCQLHIDRTLSLNFYFQLKPNVFLRICL